MTKIQTPKVRAHVREQGRRGSFHPAPRVPDLSACYSLRYENGDKQSWQRVAKTKVDEFTETIAVTGVGRLAPCQLS